MKKGLIAALGLVVVASSLLVYNKSKNDELQSDNGSRLGVSVTADSLTNYETIKNLKEASELIIRGEVLNKNSYMNGPSAITENKIKIIESYSDNAKAGDIVTVVSAGGTITYEEYSSVNGEIEKEFVDPKTLKGEELELSFEGGESLEIGKEYIIFASMQKIDAQGTKKYCIEGINQGLFKINGNTISNNYLSYTKDIKSFNSDMK